MNLRTIGIEYFILNPEIRLVLKSRRNFSLNIIKQRSFTLKYKIKDFILEHFFLEILSWSIFSR